MPLHVRPERKKRQEAEVTQAAFFEILILPPLNEQPRRLEGFRDEMSRMSFRLVRNLSLLYCIIVFIQKDSRRAGMTE
jgi:hypothetical protein